MVADDRNSVPRQRRAAKRLPLGRQEYLGTHAISHLALAALMGSTAIALVPGEALAACVNVGGTNWVCSDPNMLGQNIVQDDANVTTQPGFSIDTGDVYAVSITGLGAQVYSDGNASDLSADGTALLIRSNGGAVGGVTVTTGGTLTGGGYGVYAWNQSTGATDISATGMVEGTGNVGILATNDVAGTDLGIEAATVIGGVDGIGAYNYGTGDTVVTATGSVIGTDRMGIVAWNAATAGTIEVATGDASGAIYGIGVANGSTAVVPGDTVVTASGTVSGGQAGIRAVNGGVDVVEFLAGNSAAAVTPGGNTLIILAADVSGGEIGIDALNNGTGETWIGTTGIVEGTANQGIRAVNAATATDLTIETVTVTGGWNGIYADNGGTGETSVSATGLVQGADGTGIAVSNQATATDLTIEAATVTGAVSGISALNLGTGTTSITATGTVTGTSQHGIRAINEAATTENLLVYAADVSGGIDGIYAENFGTGATAIDASGAVTGGDDGIYAMNAATATDLSIDAVDVAGGTYGVNASNSGTGSTRVTKTGTVQGGEAGIRAINEAGALELRVEAVDVQSDLIGIEARNNGDRFTTIIATGTVHGANTGIYALNDATTTDLTIEAADVSGAGYGIYAENDGAGATSITATGVVEGAGGTGIRVWTGPAATSLTVNAADVSGNYGIYTQNGGTGATDVTVTGLAAGAEGMGILAHNAASAGDLTVTAADASGGIYGIGVANGSMTAVPGDTAVSASGTVSGGFAGILAINGGIDPASFAAGDLSGGFTAGGGDLTIEAADASGGTIGIGAQNSGTGATTVTATGTAHGGEVGISAYNGIAATDLMIDAVHAGGDTYAIIAQNSGTGATAITATGFAQGSVVATNGAAATDLTIAVSDVGGGIGALNEGVGTTHVTASGSVSAGILAQNGNSTTGLAIDAVDVASISASNEGIGATSITATGTVEGGFAGIAAYNGATATDLTIDAADVSGGTYGIYAVNEGVGATTITTGGTVTGTAAIFAGGNTIDLTNDGAILGLVSLDSAATTFTNNGVWDGAGGESLFIGGASTLVSAGTVIGGTNATLAEATTWSGLGQFTTHGTVTLVDGGAGDVLTTTGNAEFAAGSVLAVDVGGAGGTDLFLAEGAVDLVGGPTLEASISGALLYGQPYTVLTAEGGLTGTFGDLVLTSAPAAFLTMEDAYDANNAYLQTVQIRDLADAALTPNQTATAGALDDLGAGAAFEAAVSSVDDASARFAFDQLSGELHASIASTFIADSRVLRDAATNRIRGAFAAPGSDVVPILAYGPGGPELEPADPELLAAWGLAAGVWSERDGDGNAAGIESDSRYFVAGADGVLGDWRLGLLGGHSHGNFSVPDRGSSGEADSWHLGLYGGTEWDDLAFRTGLIHSWHNVTTTRLVAFPGLAETLDADFSARTLQLFGELAYGLDAGPVAFEPFAGLAYVRHDGGSYAETGGSATLSAAGSVIETTFATLGLRAETDLTLGVVEAKLRGSLAWQHAFGDLTPTVTHGFTGSSPFTVAGAPLAEDAALVEAGLDLTLSPAATLGLSYGGQFAANASDHAFRANLQVQF